MNDEEFPGDVQVKWLKFGIVMAVLYAVFTVVIILLLQFDQQLAIVVAIGGGIAMGIGVMLLTRYVSRRREKENARR